MWNVAGDPPQRPVPYFGYALRSQPSPAIQPSRAASSTGDRQPIHGVVFHRETEEHPAPRSWISVNPFAAPDSPIYLYATNASKSLPVFHPNAEIWDLVWAIACAAPAAARAALATPDGNTSVTGIGVSQITIS